MVLYDTIIPHNVIILHCHHSSQYVIVCVGTIVLVE